MVHVIHMRVGRMHIYTMIFWGMPKPCSSKKIISTDLLGDLSEPSFCIVTVIWQDPNDEHVFAISRYFRYVPIK